MTSMPIRLKKYSKSKTILGHTWHWTQRLPEKSTAHRHCSIKSHLCRSPCSSPTGVLEFWFCSWQLGSKEKRSTSGRWGDHPSLEVSCSIGANVGVASLHQICPDKRITAFSEAQSDGIYIRKLSSFIPPSSLDAIYWVQFFYTNMAYLYSWHYQNSRKQMRS